MAFTLYTGQIIQALRGIKHPVAEEYVAQLHALTERAGVALAQVLDIDHGDLSVLWDGHAAMSFGPKHPGQPLPDALEGWDTSTEWPED